MRPRARKALVAAVAVAISAAAMLALTGCLPFIPPLGGLDGGGATEPPTITVSPTIYVVGQDGTLTVGAPGADPNATHPPPAGETSPAGPGGAGDAAPTPADPSSALMLRLSPGGDGPPGDLADTLRDAEGFSATAYLDRNGIPHIGYGHQITRAEAEALLAEDLATAHAGAARVVGEPTWSALSQGRRDALVELAYMLGETGLGRFTKMLEAIRSGDLESASDEIAASRLDRQVPRRAARLATVMREG